MTWPTSPANGAQTTINGITYQYSTTTGAWNRLGQVFGNVSSTSYTVANLVVTASAQLGNLANVTIAGGGSGQYIATDGAGHLTWSAVSSGAFIANGTSNVAASTSNGNVTIGVAGTPNTVVFTSTGINVSGTSNVLGNANVGNIGAGVGVFTGNISALNASLGNLATANFYSGSGNLLSNIQGANVSGAVTYATTANAVAGANVSGQVGNALIAGTVYTNAQPNITSVGTLSSLAVTGNITAGNANLGNLLIANFHSGSGNLLSNIQGANVSGAVAYATTANAIAGANVSGAVAFATTANAVAGANVSGAVTYAATANAVAGANVSGQVGNALIAGTVYTNAQPNITSVGTLTSLTATGNITAGNANLGNLLIANFHSGSGNLLSNIQGANVSGAVAFATTANAVAGANITGQVSNSLIAGTVYTNAQPNITSVGTLTSLVVTGNITSGNASLGNLATANFYSGSGNLLSNIQGANVSGQVGNALIAGTVYTNAQPNITSVGTLTSLAVTGATTHGNVVTLMQTTDILNALTGATGTVVHDLNTGGVWYHSSIAANFTCNVTNVPTTNNRTIIIVLILSQGATPYVPNALQIDGVAQTIKWSNGTVPTGTASKLDFAAFTLLRVGSAWVVAGQVSSFG